MTAPDGALPVDEALRTALRERSSTLLAEALREGTVLLGLEPAGDSRRPLVLVDADGTRALPAFSGPDAVQAFGGVERVGLVRAGELVTVGREQRVDLVLLDPAGPAPAEFGLDELRRLADGLVPGHSSPQALAVPFQVREAARVPPGLRELLDRIAEDRRLPLWLFERRSAGEPVLTLGVEGGPDDAAAVAARVGAWAADVPERIDDVDVVVLDPTTVQALSAQVPSARTPPSGER